MSEDYDKKVERLVLRMAQGRMDADPISDEHLRTCPDAHVDSYSGGDGDYGCDSGCEFVRLEADIVCSHGHCARYEYGSFGDMWGLMYDLDQLEKGVV